MERSPEEWREVFPEELLYNSTHEWAKVESNRVTVGITGFAETELGDVTYIKLPAVGDKVEANQPFGIIESIKAIEDLYAPVSGTVVAINEELIEEGGNRPEIVNFDPYGQGWMIIVEMENPDELKLLMPAEAYRQMLEREGRI